MGGGLACFRPQGMLRMDVPIMVFHTANLGGRAEASRVSLGDRGGAGGRGSYMVTMLGFLDEASLPPTLKAVPSGQ